LPEDRIELDPPVTAAARLTPEVENRRAMRRSPSGDWKQKFAERPLLFFVWRLRNLFNGWPEGIIRVVAMLIVDVGDNL
jgi:hypothetical protein